jgi:hypothetical protein
VATTITVEEETITALTSERQAYASLAFNLFTRKLYTVYTTAQTDIQHFAPLGEHCHNSKNTTFQDSGKTTGRGDAIASKERHFSPLAAILENKRVTLFH